MSDETVTTINTAPLSINASFCYCALCGKPVEARHGICDETNIGWKTWHNECYETHRELLGIGRRFPVEPKFKPEPQYSHSFRVNNRISIGGHWEFDDLTESEFLGDVGDK